MTTITAGPKTRISGIDRARGFAIILMMFQHFLLLYHGPNAWESTGGRLVAPIFLIVGGSLVTRMSIRHIHVFILGIFLTIAVPWAGNPSILIYYVISAFIIWGIRRVNFALLWIPVFISLALYANGIWVTPNGQYSPMAALALMCIGSLIGRTIIGNLGGLLPKWEWLAFIGRHPLAFYAGHLMLLEALRGALT